MILLNFGKKMDTTSLEMFNQMCGQKITEQIMLPIDSSSTQGFMTELEKCFVKVKLSDEELGSDRVVINPSTNQYAMSVVMAYLLKKTGKLPYLIATRASAFGLSARMEINEVIDLQKWAE